MKIVRVTVISLLLAISTLGGVVLAGVPVTGLLDDFNRADGPIGSSWTEQNGQFSVVSNAVQGGSLALATFDGATSDTLEADLETATAGLQYVALVLAYANLSNNLFLKVQRHSNEAGFNHAACYYGNNGSSFGLGFFNLDSEFTTAHMKVTLEGTTVTMTFSKIDGGTATQTYVCSGAPATGGAGIGIGGYANKARLDNFSAGGSPPPVPVPIAYSWALMALAVAFAGLLASRRWRTRVSSHLH